MRSTTFLLLSLLLGCASPAVRLERASQLLGTGQAMEARRQFARLAASHETALRVRAALGAAQASAMLRDRPAQRQWLERAAAPPESPGLSEEAYLQLADVLAMAGEDAEARSLYYRAAAAAERSGRRDVYQRAVQRLAASGVN